MATKSVATSEKVKKQSHWPILTRVEQLQEFVPGLSAERLLAAKHVASELRFRLPTFYAKNILNGDAADPLLEIVLPAVEELDDGDELWDSTGSPYKASASPFWIQKYEFQGLIRVTSFCSGLCRFCYLKKKHAKPSAMREADVNALFDDLEERGESLHEIIISGGDPLAAAPPILALIGERMLRLRRCFGPDSPHLTVHTREPVWDPVRLLQNERLWDALDCLGAKTYMINVLHPREVTAQFKEVCARLGELGGRKSRPALFAQHPLFRGVNDSVATLESLYRKLFSCSPPVIPYYIVHPFYNGTLRRHVLSIAESQRIYRELLRRPGVLVPRLVVPTPLGKCVVGPNDLIKRTPEGYHLTTKDGVQTTLAE